MSKSTILFLVLMGLHQLVCSQSNDDDYWLGNGFSSGDTVITNSGWFYDDGGDGLYNEGPNWDVTFCSENGNPITLDFSGFKTHFGGVVGDTAAYRDYDYITINYTGINGYVAYHDDTPEFSFTSPDGCIDIGFISDSDGLVDSGWVAEIFAIPPPFNNDPFTAEELVVGNSCSPSFYTNKGAYDTTSLGSPGCKTFFGGDVWFQLVVPDSGVVKIETFPGTLTYAILDIYNSSDADITSGERITCVDDGGIMPSVTLTSDEGIAPGDVLYIRLFGEQAKSGLFGICATDPSAPVTGYTGPGGVGDAASLDFWYKADRGLLNGGSAVIDGGQVEIWEDQSGNDAHLEQSNSSYQPIYITDTVNGFGAVSFDGFDYSLTYNLGTAGAPLHWFAAGAFVGNTRQTMLSVGDAAADKTASISRDINERYFSFTTADRIGPDFTLTDGQFYLFNASHLLAAPYHFLELNGAPQTVDAEVEPLLSNGVVQIGASWDGNDPFNGYVSELIQFSKSLNSAQEIIINNYLSAKYDMALSANDLYAYKDTFYYDVAGIGRVNAGNMHTKAESAGILTIGGADDLDNNEFLFFGHDNGDFSTWSDANIPSGDTNIVRLDRIWKVGLEGSPGQVSVSLKKSALPSLPPTFSAYNLFIDSDGDFSSGAMAYGPFEIGSELVMNHINLSDGDHIAVAAVRPVVSFTTAAESVFESVNNPQIEVVLNYAVSTVVEIDYSVVDATATQGVDFSLLPSTISINPGNKSGFIAPLIINDTIPETPDEYFDIEISTSTPGVTAGGITLVRHTILNDDLAIEVSASDNTIGACATSLSEITVEAAGTGPFTYSWTPGTGLNVTDNDTVLANPSVTTTYTVEVTDTYGLSKTKDIEIEVVPVPVAPTITADGATAFCSGDSLKLSAPKGYSSYLWSTFETTDSIWVKSSGGYNVVVTDSFGCSSPASTDVSVTVYPLPTAPVVTPDGITAFCEGDSVDLVAEAGYSSYLWSDGSTEASLKVKTGGEYFVSGTDGNSCSSENSDTITVTVHSNPSQPIITADGSTEFCPGDSVKLSVPAGFSGYMWSTGQTDNEIYARSAGNYNVSVTNSNGCVSPVSEDVLVTVYPLPTAPVVTPDGITAFCEGDSVELVAEAGYSSYLWSDGSTEASLKVKTGGEYFVSGTDGNSCSSENSDTITVTVHPNPSQPIITADGSTEFCPGDSVKLSVPAGFSGYMWSTGQTDNEIYARSAGNYTVSVTNSNGCVSPVSEDVLVMVYPMPTAPVVTPDGITEFCEGDSVDLVAEAGYSSYLWSDGSTEASLKVKTGGEYFVSGTDGNSCSSENSDTITVTVHSNPSQPIITADGSTEFCPGDSVKLSVPAGFSGYMWSTGQTDNEIYARSAGNYNVSVTNSNGCVSPVSEDVLVTVYPLPTAPVVTPDGITAFCEGDSVELVAEAGYSSYLWSDGSTEASLKVKTGGEYFVSGTDGNSCSSENSDTITVTVHPNPSQPIITADGSTEFCPGDSVKLSVPAGFSGYMWSTGQTDNEIYARSAGNYTVSVTNSNGCVSPVSEDVLVMVYPMPTAPVVTPDGITEFCEGDSVDLVAEAGYSSYLWSDGSTEASLKVKTGGEYFVSGTDGNGCSSENSDTVTVTIYSLPDKPVITADGSLFVITGNTVQLSGPASAAYLWTPGGETTQSINVSTSGSYSLFVENEFGCTSPESDPVEVVVSDFLPPPTVTVSGSLDFCDGGSVMLTGPDGFEQYNWSDGSTGQSISVTEEVEITLVVTNNEGVQSLPSDLLTVVVYEIPEIQILERIEPSCATFDNGSITVSAIGGLAPYQFSWQGFQESSSTLSGIPAGNFTSTVVDENGCTESLGIELDEPASITVEEVVEPVYCPDFSDGSIELVISGGTAPYYISWSGGGTADYLNNLSPGDYSYEVKDGNNCQVDGTIQLGYENEVCFIVPGIITPNDDGFNDTWRIDGLEVYPDVIVEIFDRWGKRVFYSEGYDTDFDGTFDGRELPMESYHYMIDLNNGSERIIGNITIVR